MTDNQDSQRNQANSSANAQDGSIAIGSLGVTGDGDKNIIVGNNNSVVVNNYQDGAAPLNPILAVPPAPPKYFTGRKQQVSDIVAALAEVDANPVIVIQGMGGVGKTALIKQVAKETASRFPGGFFWGDELPPKDGNPSIILKQWGRLCGQNLEKENDENLPTTIRGLLMAYQAQFGDILIIVDGVRSDWAGDGVDSIRQALPPGVPLLITTRQTQVALELDAKVFALDVFSRAESIQLLQSVSEGNIDDVQANTFAELSGDIPLALELIAKISKKRRSDWLLSRMQDETNHMNSLKLDDAHRKEQSVRVSFDLNYQSLVEQYPESARIFRSLAAFAQPTFIILEHFTDALAQSSIQKSPVEISEKAYKRKRLAEDDVLRLADWSLLSKESLAGSEMQHFHLHTLLHEYARSLLVEAAEIDEAANTHINYCVAFAEANPQIDLQIQQKSTLEFEKNHEQLFRALNKIRDRHLAQGMEWGSDPKAAHQVISLVNPMDHHWQWYSHFSDQVEWLQIAYNCAQGDSIKQADYARRMGRALSWQGKLDEAGKWMETCKTALGDDSSEAANDIRALMYIHGASINYQQNAFETAEKNCTRGLELVDEKKQPKIYAEGYNLLGVIKMRLGALPSAFKAVEKSLSIWKQLGDQYQINRVGDNLRTILYYLGDIAQLRKAEEESLQYWEKFPDRVELAMALTNRGLVHQIDGEYGVAIELQKRALGISDALTIQRIRALIRVNLAWPLIALEKYDEAEGYLNQSMEIQKQFNTTENWIEANRALAVIAFDRKQYARTNELAGDALQLAKENDDPLEEGAALRILGLILQTGGELEQARERLEKSLSVLRENEYKYESYLTLQSLINLYEAMGDEQKGLSSITEARTLSQEMGLNPSQNVSE